MSRFDAAIASAFTSAGAFVVATGPALWMGISGLGSGVATTVRVFDGTSTGGRTIAIVPFGAAGGVLDGPFAPIVCTGGITATNIGTVAGYCILYASLDKPNVLFK